MADTLSSSLTGLSTVCCLEVVEHVTEVDHFVAGLAKYGGTKGLM